MERPARKLALVQKADDKPEGVRVAFASSDNEVVDQHFGSAVQFAIYKLSPSQWQLIELVEFATGPAGHNSHKLKLRIDALTQCVAIYCNAIGSSAIKQLLALHIKPVTVSPSIEIKKTLTELVSQLQENPRHWLAKNHLAQVMSSNEDKDQHLAQLLEQEWEL